MTGSDVVAAVVVVDVVVDVTDDVVFVVDVPVDADGDVAAHLVSYVCKSYLLNLEAFSEDPCAGESAGVGGWVYVECVDGGRWSVGNTGHLAHNAPLIPENHDDGEDGNVFDPNSLVLHHLQFCCSSAAVVVDVVVYAAVVAAVDVVVVDAVVVGAVVVGAVAVSLGTSPTDCQVQLHSLCQRRLH